MLDKGVEVFVRVKQLVTFIDTIPGNNRICCLADCHAPFAEGPKVLRTANRPLSTEHVENRKWTQETPGEVEVVVCPESLQYFRQNQVSNRDGFMTQPV